MQTRRLTDIQRAQAGNVAHQRRTTRAIGTCRKADVGDRNVPNVVPCREVLQQAGRDRGHDLVCVWGDDMTIRERRPYKHGADGQCVLTAVEKW